MRVHVRLASEVFRVGFRCVEGWFKIYVGLVLPLFIVLVQGLLHFCAILKKVVSSFFGVGCKVSRGNVKQNSILFLMRRIEN